MITGYSKIYMAEINEAMNSVPDQNLKGFYNCIMATIVKKYPILVMGNGGSCSIAEHLSCDWMKGISQDSKHYPEVRSLVSNQALMTALANDYGYEHVFEKQIEYTSEPSALVIGISSSGNSPNIIHGFRAASEKGYACLSMVGFDGGEIVKERLTPPTLTIHVRSDNYGIVEDTHSLIMHMIAQSIRLELSRGELKSKL